MTLLIHTTCPNTEIDLFPKTFDFIILQRSIRLQSKDLTFYLYPSTATLQEEFGTLDLKPLLSQTSAN
jgi:hypothetical protein